MLTIGRLVKFDIPRFNRGPQSMYQILAEYYGKEFESLKGTVAFVNASKQTNEKEGTISFKMAGFIEFPEHNYAKPEMFVIAKEHFPYCFSVGFISERPYNAEPESIFKESDFENFRKEWKKFTESPEARKYGIQGGAIGSTEPIFDYMVAQTPFSGKTATDKPTGLYSFGRENFISFAELSGDADVICDCPKCDPGGRKAKLLDMLEMLHKMAVKEKDPYADKMPNGMPVSEFIRTTREGTNPDSCHKAQKKAAAAKPDQDEIDKEMERLGKVLPFPPDKDKGNVH